jgi:hypothetical protein
MSALVFPSIAYDRPRCGASHCRVVTSKEEGRVLWFVLTHFVAFFVDVIIGTRRGDRDKDL